jgi:hypothetical protein
MPQPGTRFESDVAPESEEFDDLVQAASASTDFWDNDWDDEDWNSVDKRG